MFITLCTLLNFLSNRSKLIFELLFSVQFVRFKRDEAEGAIVDLIICGIYKDKLEVPSLLQIRV
jgi:hypothetical protein